MPKAAEHNCRACGELTHVSMIDEAGERVPLCIDCWPIVDAADAETKALALKKSSTDTASRSLADGLAGSR